jgi:WD40 repeat protein
MGTSQGPAMCVHVCFVLLHAQAWEPAHKALPSRRFVSGSKDQTVRIWDANTRRCLFTMSSHTMIVTCVRWGGEGLIYSGSRDCCINVWDAAEGKLVRTLKGHAHWVNTLALSTEAVLRSGAYDHTGKAPADPQESMQVCVCCRHCCQERCRQCCQTRPQQAILQLSAFYILCCFYNGPHAQIYRTHHAPQWGCSWIGHLAVHITVANHKP